MQRLLLTAQEAYRLRTQLKTTSNARVYRRTLAILGVAAGRARLRKPLNNWGQTGLVSTTGLMRILFTGLLLH